MMLAHAHYVYVLKEFLPDRKPQRKTQNAGSRRQSEDTDDSAQSLDRDSENSETGQGDFLDQYQPTAPSTVHDFSEYQKDEDDEIDLERTKESLWDLLTGRF